MLSRAELDARDGDFGRVAELLGRACDLEFDLTGDSQSTSDALGLIDAFCSLAFPDHADCPRRDDTIPRGNGPCVPRKDDGRCIYCDGLVLRTQVEPAQSPPVDYEGPRIMMFHNRPCIEVVHCGKCEAFVLAPSFARLTPNRIRAPDAAASGIPSPSGCRSACHALSAR